MAAAPSMTGLWMWSCLVACFLAVGAYAAKLHTHRSFDERSYNFTIGAWDEQSLVTLGGCADFEYNFLERNGNRHSSAAVLTPAFKTFCAGRATFVDPIPLYKPKKNSHSHTAVSFKTTFTFTIQTKNSYELPGDGFAFFIDTNNGNHVPESYGGEMLGLYSNASDAAGDPSVRVVAVEFDTFENPELSDINANHVGLNVHSIVSTVAADLSPIKIFLTSGSKISVIIEYDASLSLLEVRMENGKDITIPHSHRVIYAGLDLARLVKNPSSYVGFSAGTGSQTQIVSIHSWAFESWEV